MHRAIIYLFERDKAAPFIERYPVTGSNEPLAIVNAMIVNQSCITCANFDSYDTS